MAKQPSVRSLKAGEEPEFDWEGLVLAPLHSSNGEMFSTADVLIRKRYKQAFDGDVRAARDMIKAARANAKARKAQQVTYNEWDDPLEQRRRRAKEREARLADPALLLLGIAAVDNEAFRNLGEPGEPGFAGRLARLRPTHLAQWVVDYAKSRSGHPARDLPYSMTGSVLPEDHPELSVWREAGDWLLAHLVRTRGPGATRFQEGISPNPSGRPRGRKTEPEDEDLPFDRFFSELTEIPAGGKLITVTRLDALIWKLMVEAGKGNDQLLNLLAPRMVDLVTLQWKSRVPTAIMEDYRG